MCGAHEADGETGVRPLTSATEATMTWPDQTLEGCGHDHTERVEGRCTATQDQGSHTATLHFLAESWNAIPTSFRLFTVNVHTPHTHTNLNEGQILLCAVLTLCNQRRPIGLLCFLHFSSPQMLAYLQSGVLYHISHEGPS